MPAMVLVNVLIVSMCSLLFAVFDCVVCLCVCVCVSVVCLFLLCLRLFVCLLDRLFVFLLRCLKFLGPSFFFVLLVFCLLLSWSLSLLGCFLLDDFVLLFQLLGFAPFVFCVVHGTIFMVFLVAGGFVCGFLCMVCFFL